MSDRVWTRLRADRPRYWVASGLSAVLTALGIAGALVAGVSATVTASYLAIVYFVSWVLFCVLYSAITWRVLQPVDGATLADWLRENEGQRRSRQRSESMYGTGGPSGAVMLCAVALAAVIAVAALPDLRDNLVTLGLAVAVVASTWLLLVVVYALHYARESTHAGGLVFPGLAEREAPVFSDFVYLATSVATGFATSDVSVHTTAMRREVTVHALIAFAFNTVVIALLVSLLITVGG